MVKMGDSVSVAYTDEFPADFTLQERTSTFTMTVGPHGDGATLTPSIPTLSTNGSLAAGKQAMLSTTLINHNDRLRPFVELLEVKDSSDVTVFLAWQSGTLEPLGQTDIGVSWTPDQPGNYEARTFAISDLDNPQVLSMVTVPEFTVE